MNRFNFTKKQFIIAGVAFVVFAMLVIFIIVIRNEPETTSQTKVSSDSEKIIEVLKNDSATSAMELHPQYASVIKSEGNWYIASVTFTTTENSVTYTIVLLKDVYGTFSIAAGPGDSFDNESLKGKGIPETIIDRVISKNLEKEINE